MRLPVPLLAPIAFALALAACGPTLGGSCKGDLFSCSGSSSVLECRDSEWREAPCRGPDGCVEEGGQVSCDVDGSRVNDPCVAAHEGASVCSADRTARLECRDGFWQQSKACPNTPCSSSGLLCG